jgi:hypothetical protein
VEGIFLIQYVKNETESYGYIDIELGENKFGKNLETGKPKPVENLYVWQ